MNRHLNILAIETSTSAGSVAVVRASDLKVLALNEWVRGRSHAEVATPALADAIAIAGGLSELGAIAVGVGPGSFTGIRVGLNSAKTAAWNLGLPVLGFSSTAILLEGVKASGLIGGLTGGLSAGAGGDKNTLVAAVLNAQMGMVFCSFFDEEPRALSPDAFAEELVARAKKSGQSSVALVGDGNLLVDELVEARLKTAGLKSKKLDASLDHPHAATLGRMAASKLGPGFATETREALVRKYPWQSVQPLYLRGSGAEEKRG